MNSLHPTKSLRFILTALVLGIFFSFGGYWYFWGLLFLFFVIFGLKWKKNIFFPLAFFCGGFGYGSYSDEMFLKKDSLLDYHHQKVDLRGTITSSVQYKKSMAQAHFKTESMFQNNQWVPIYGNLLLKLPVNTKLLYGETIQVSGKLSSVQNFGGFDYQAYLRRYGVQTILSSAQNIKKIPIKNYFYASISFAQKVRNFFSENIKKNLPIPHADIASGVLLGIQQSLPEKISENFKNSGLQHILVVSGTNVAIVLILLNWFFRPLGPRITLGMVFLGLLFFLGMIGGDPPVLRAVIFGFIASLAVFLGRVVDSMNLIMATVALVALFSPQTVKQDLSFFLTFSATVGIILGIPLWWKISGFIKQKALRVLLGVSFCAQFGVFPVLVLFFGNFPTSGILSNLFVEPFIPLIMGLSSFLGILGSFPVISPIIAFFDYWGIQMVIWIAEFFSRFGVFKIPEIFGFFGFIGFLGFIFWAFFSVRYDEILRKYEAYGNDK